MLTRQDFENGLNLIKSIFCSDSLIGTHTDCYSVDDIVKRYSKSDSDEILVAHIWTTDDTIDDEDNLIPRDESDWYNKHNTTFIKQCDKIDSYIDKLFDKINKECVKKYRNIFKFDYDKTWDAILVYICSNKPKESSSSDNK